MLNLAVTNSIKSKYIIRDFFQEFHSQKLGVFIICVHGVMVIVVGNGHGDTSSNPGRDWLHFT